MSPNGVTRPQWVNLLAWCICLPLGLFKGTVSGVWKTMEVPAGEPSRIQWNQGVSHTIFRSANHKASNTSQWDVMSHTPPIVLQPPSQDCVAVYNFLETSWHTWAWPVWIKIILSAIFYDYTSAQEIWRGLYWNQSVRLSVCLSGRPRTQYRCRSHECNSSRIAVKLGRDIPWDKISTEFEHAWET